MKILALDLGTHMGVAHNMGGSLEATTITLAKPAEITAWGKKRMDRRDDQRIHRMSSYLRNFGGCCAPDVVVFEDVEFQTYTMQCQLWSSYRTVVWMTFSGRSTLDCVPVASLKKFATGYGGADKALMKKHLLLKHPGIECGKLDDNAIDAIWLHLWAQHNLGRIKT